ncbi:MAG: hypothetical protein AAB586_01065 [Patescibacteria group bacterium]
MAPAFLFVWFMTAICAGVVDTTHGGTICFNWRAAFGKSDRRLLSGSLPIFWAVILYSFLPIILHWSAMLLGKVGYGTVSSLLDTHRYASLLYIFIAILMLLFFTSMTVSVWKNMKNMWVQFMSRFFL